jgi:hypothetical protein
MYIFVAALSVLLLGFAVMDKICGMVLKKETLRC